MTPNQSHLAGLELALQQWDNGGPSAHFAAQLRGLIDQAKATPAEPFPKPTLLKECNVRYSNSSDPAEAAHGEAVPCLIGIRGRAYDQPGTRRAYTYAEQPDNIGAHKLGRAVESTLALSAGDWIDRGLGLLKTLSDEGYGVFELGAEYTAPPPPDAELVALLQGLVEIVSRKNRGRPGSPNHGHTIPGIWDSDNGDLAGKPCAECALYDLAIARISTFCHV